MKWFNFIAAFTVLTIITVPAASAEPFTYKPENCEFEMTFPEEPHTTRRCHPDMKERCELITGYTKVYDLSVTMNFYVSCKAITAETAAGYDKELLRASLIGMAGRSRLEEYQTAFDDQNDVLRGSILAAGRSANERDEMLYMGQIWVGDHSVMTVEGELIGSAYEQSDEDFATILQSITATDWTNAGPEESSDSPAEQAETQDHAGSDTQEAPPAEEPAAADPQ